MKTQVPKLLEVAGGAARSFTRKPAETIHECAARADDIIADVKYYLATAAIDCVSAKCGAINVQSAGATKVTCGQGSCNAAMFQGSNITVDCTTKNSCNAISCKGQDIVTNCDFNPKKYVSSKCRGIAPPNPCFS